MEEPASVEHLGALWQLHGFTQGLLPASSAAAERAVVALSEGDEAGACAAAGQAVELVAKAYLAGVNPVLLVAPNVKDVDDYLLLAGRGHYSKRDLLTVRTIAAEEAYVRAMAFLGSRPDSTWLRQRTVFRARGAAIHLGQVERGSGRKAVAEMVRLALPVLTGLGVAPEDWLGEQAPLALLVLDESKKAEAVVAQARIRAATERWQELSKSIPDHTREVLSRAIAAAAGTGDRIRECPVGGHDATWSGDWEVSLVQDSEPGWRDWEYVPHEIRCGVCGLHLDDYEQLDALGLGDPIEYEAFEVEGYETEDETEDEDTEQSDA